MSSDFKIVSGPPSVECVLAMPAPTLEIVKEKVSTTKTPIVPIGYVSDPTIQTPGIAQKTSITLLGIHTEIPSVVSAKWKRENFRFGVSVGTITRFDPNSLEFENSINWKLLTSKTPLFDTSRNERRKNGNTPLWGVRQSSVSAMLYRQLDSLKNSDLTHASIEHDLSFLVEKKIITEKERLKLTGRKKARVEQFWEIRGVCRKNDFKKYIRAVLSAWSVSDDASGIGSTQAFYDRIHGGICGVGVNRGGSFYKNRLINVFEIYSGTPALCLSFAEFIPRQLSKGESIEGEVFHIWIRPAIEETLKRSAEGVISDQTDVYFREDMSPAPYILGGLPRLAWKIYMSTLGVNVENSSLQVKTDIGVVDLKLGNTDYSALVHKNFDALQFSRWGSCSSVEDSFNIRGFCAEGPFGLGKSAEGIFMDNPVLLRIKNFDVLQKILRNGSRLILNLSRLSHLKPGPITTLADSVEVFRLGFSAAILQCLSITDSLKDTITKHKLKSISKNSVHVEGQSCANFIRKLAQVEFRANLKV